MIWCLHGAVGMAADWKQFAGEMVADGHEVRRVDLWRYLDCCPMEMPEFARAFCEEVRSGGSGENILVGYSMGGRLALQVLVETAAGGEPDLFRSAVIVSAHPGLSTDRDRVMRMAADAEWAGRALVGEWSEFLESWEDRMQSGPLGWRRRPHGATGGCSSRGVRPWRAVSWTGRWESRKTFGRDWPGWDARSCG